MEFMQLIKARFSVRTYKPDPVPDDVLQQVLDAAHLAPSAKNLQPYQLIVIQTQGREEELMRVYNRDWFVQPPLVVCIVVTPSEAWSRGDGKNFCYVDAAIAMDHLILAATDLGLGTCWIGAFNVDVAREVLGLPDGVEPVVFTPLGYPDEPPTVKRRKDLSELVRHERW
jgi:nitroreductase